jgi:hypothetical protein
VTSSDRVPDADGHFLSPRLRYLLYGIAALVLVFWLSLEFFGAAGFLAFLVAMGIAQLAFRWRPSLNVAFVVGMVAYGLTLAVWVAAVGPPHPGNLHATQTAAAGDVD